MTLGVFASGLGLVWLLGGGAKQNRGAQAGGERTFTFPLNSTSSTVSVRSPWRLGHMTPQDDEVELTLVGKCATAHLYAYLSTGWDHGPLNAASIILGTKLHPTSGPTPRVVRHDASSAVVVITESGRGVVVQEASPRNYNTLLVQWQTTRGCVGNERTRAARELGRLFDSFTVVDPALVPRGAEVHSTL
ncbi:MAG TPA: hypothetical protein VJU79_05700 [Candidatus Dormibacteraeota bacterium]|nr:hypothetical protein [Candidatus Dormibacteraeota bacterium]